MEEGLAYCGLLCRTCPIYLATREKVRAKQRQMRAEIVRQIERHYGGPCKPQDVGDCDGCKAESGRLFCTDCRIRTCASGKGIENCAPCADYPCEAIERLFTTDAGARERLDAIRAAL